MLINTPFFADLSTYTPQKTMAFYKALFNWKYYQENDYFMAYINNTAITGLYETPPKFKQLRMPHFWMTYIQVKNVTKIIENVEKNGGRIEISYELDVNEKVALVRDPLGAGFTIYEGSKLKNARTKDTKNTLIWNELHVSNLGKVIPFYQNIFHWEFKKIRDDFYYIINEEKLHIGDILEIPNSYKGKYEYWVCTFGVENLKLVKQKVMENGGSEITIDDNRILCTDNSKEAFFYLKEV
ncbi:VOC family protein [Tenacibaculum sp. 190524A02b]|uniref:VOC family protein n=1 Tax=Tenacibaculum vairaonense TaxID=3137860 RepID=UPI0031FABD96